MKAAVLKKISVIKVEGRNEREQREIMEEPLVIEEVPEPTINKNQLLIKVSVCGVCYTDIDIIEGRVKCSIPIIPGHQIVGKIVDIGKEAKNYSIGDRVGVAWIGLTCGNCFYCITDQENLCENFKATGCHINGGYAQYTVAFEDYTYLLPKNVDDEHVAPLLCAGAVGYRALKLLNMVDGLRLGLFGFGSSAHIIIQIARKLYPSSEIYVFTRSIHHQEHARKLGADWVGSPYEDPPRKIDRAIDFTPAGEIIGRTLEVLNRGGKIVINVIRKQTPIVLDYVKHMWLEKEVKTVANITRKDVTEFIRIVEKFGVDSHIQRYKFEEVNKALRDLKAAKVVGSPILKIN
ncbi:MAG: alcohol dehydrogenase catalytic domain-containing protein [Ignisphaera sp.]